MRKAIIENGVVVNIVVASDEAPGINVDGLNVGVGDLYDGTLFSKPPPRVPTLEEARATAKAARQAAVDAITVTAGGKVFDGDEVAQTRMARAILGMQAAGVATINWTLANNVSVAVTLAELTEALILAGQRQAELWPLP